VPALRVVARHGGYGEHTAPTRTIVGAEPISMASCGRHPACFLRLRTGKRNCEGMTFPRLESTFPTAIFSLLGSSTEDGHSEERRSAINRCAKPQNLSPSCPSTMGKTSPFYSAKVAEGRTRDGALAAAEELIAD